MQWWLKLKKTGAGEERRKEGLDIWFLVASLSVCDGKLLFLLNGYMFFVLDALTSGLSF